MTKNNQSTEGSSLFVASVEESKLLLNPLSSEALPKQSQEDQSFVFVKVSEDKVLMNQVLDAYSIKEVIEQHPFTQDELAKIVYFKDCLYMSLNISFYKDDGTLDSNQYIFICSDKFTLCFYENSDFLKSLGDEGSFYNLPKMDGFNPILFCFTVMDYLVKEQVTTVSLLNDKIVALDVAATENPSQKQIDTFNALNKEASSMIIDSRPFREILQAFSSGSITYKDRLPEAYYNNIYNRMSFLVDSLEYKKNYILNLKDYILASINNRMGMIAQILAVMGTIFMPLTFVTGVYGMNFENMPELAWENAYFYCLVAMVLMVVVQFIYFKIKKII